MSKFRLGTHPQQHRQMLAKLLQEAQVQPSPKAKIDWSFVGIFSLVVVLSASAIYWAFHMASQY